MKNMFRCVIFLLLGFANIPFLHGQSADTNFVLTVEAKADTGNAEAQNQMGVLYEKGLSVTQNYETALKWYHLAAAQGDTEAECNLGRIYYLGLGVPINYANALAWLTKSATKGNAQAEGLLGLMYEKGQGVACDDTLAVQWYAKAAAQGEKFAQVLLAVMYQNGRGVTQDYVEAYKWYNVAAADNGSAIAKARDALAHLMTPEQIAQGQELAHKFVPRKEAPESF